jgi:hypothetical protein
MESAQTHRYSGKRRGHSWLELQVFKEVLDLREVQQAFCDDGTALAEQKAADL